MTEPIRTLLTGATGTLGGQLRPRLRDAGHAVRAASRSPPSEPDADAEWVEMDLADGTGIEAALENVDVVVHAASAPRGDTEAVDVEGTRRLLDAAAQAGISNVCYVSIVGVDSVPLTYYQHKLEAERAAEASEVPSTIVRLTQFHSFVFDVLEAISRVPVWPLPVDVPLQPIEPGEAAAAVVDRATADPQGRVPPVGGPEVRTVGELARAYRTATGSRRPIVPVPIPGAVAAGFRSGEATCPDRTVGTTTWKRWLAHQSTS
ncbi:NAD-dependent epimerase/dehydratase family protein [Natrarchaeobius halalkaliphilus]|uniref:NAD-dependent epimerase/dehydratase family protein n=1 Tax=Natrarchaeobius halalkaliphilus TaxID=1679091 RepID=A0A3N6M1Y3_9EURY|nr:NAD(P)H-binding protein [Natrarchaeobius halalkaliphilus]RQG89101.1 NAD-dependent epimerase/dehydratase family protein [Natrarchaeobius halalkaliphilus]